MRKKHIAKRKKSLGLRDEGELGYEKTIKLLIHYGGTMKNNEDGEPEYFGGMGTKTVFWKFEEIEWVKFEELSSSAGTERPVNLIHYKGIGAEMRSIDYVFDKLNGDMSNLSGCAKEAGEIEVYLEHGITENDKDDYEQADDEGYNPDDEKALDEEDRPPREEEDPQDSEDENPANEVDGNPTEEVPADDPKRKNVTEVDDGEEVIIDSGNGGDDDRFLTVFEEGSQRDPCVEAGIRELLQAQEKEAKEAESDVSDPDFGLDDVMYPDTPLESDEEWEQWKHPKKKSGENKSNKHFNGDPDSEPFLWLFQTFNSGLEFKDQLLKYSLNTCFDVKMAKSEANRIAVVCKRKKCPFRVFCSIEKPLNKWMVKVCHCKHDHGKSSRVSMLKQGVIAGLFREEIRRNIHLPASDIKDIIKERYDIVVNMSKCFKARRIALDSILEDQTIQFGKLWDYEFELKRSNKDISTEILTVELEGREHFRGFYICFKDMKESWKKWCRPVIGLDGCFLKWDLEGDLLAAVGRDADNKMYPIAWAVVTGENMDTWGWFIKKLKVDLDIGLGKDLTVISDKQKGLIHAMGVELPLAEHRMCARHIYANWKKGFAKAEYKNLFWGVAYSYHEGEFKEKMKNVETYDRVAYEALLKTDPQRWCRAFFDPKSHCADVHNNLSEAFNRTIKMARTKPVITMLEDIRCQAMRRISRRWFNAIKITSFLTPITMAILENARVAKKYCRTIHSSTNLYEVTEYETVGYTVDLAAHQCACKKWDLTGIPCRHAVCVFDDNEQDPEKFVANYYEASVLKQTYELNIKPVNGERMWTPTEKPPIAIPNIRKPRGRPKTRDRRKDPFEDLQNPGKVTRHGRIFHCSQCGQAGHIKSGCKNEPVVVEGPKNRRGRPRKFDPQLTPTQTMTTTAPVPKPKKPKSAPKPNQKKRKGELQTGGSQPLQINERCTEFPASSSAPEPSVSSNKPKPRKRARQLKTTTVENTPRGAGMFTSPFTGRPFQAFGDKVYHPSSQP